MADIFHQLTKTALATLALTTSALVSPAMAFEGATQAALDAMKIGKTVQLPALRAFMQGSERWCYAEQNGTCAWSDIYLEVGQTEVFYEGGALWDEHTEIALTTQAALRDGRFICEVFAPSAPTTRALKLPENRIIGGRELAALKAEIAANEAADTKLDCFDYALVAIDPNGENIVLNQRQHVDGQTDPANDVLVTLHFDPEIAQSLQLRW